MGKNRILIKFDRYSRRRRDESICARFFFSMYVRARRGDETIKPIYMKMPKRKGHRRARDDDGHYAPCGRRRRLHDPYVYITKIYR